MFYPNIETALKYSRDNIGIALNPNIEEPENEWGCYRVEQQQKVFHKVNLCSKKFMPSFLTSLSPQMALGAMVRDIEQCENPAVKKTLPFVQQAFEVTVFMDALKYIKIEQRNSEIDKFAKTLKEQAKNLDHECFMPLPIGTATHGMFMQLMCVIKEGMRTYQVKVYNSGMESRNQGAPVPPLTGVPTLVIDGIDSDAIEDSPFINILLHAASIENSGFFNSFIHNVFSSAFASQIYQNIQTYLIVRGHGVVRANTNPLLVHHHQGIFSGACVTKSLNFWLQETVGKVAYREFKVIRTEAAIRRLTHVKGAEERYFGKRWCTIPNFFYRFLYFIFNFISIDAQLSLSQDVLEKRKRKFKEISK